MKGDVMNKTEKNESIKKSKPNSLYLHSRERKSLASVLIFMKVSKQNKRAGR
jgi:hypothetical protein